MRLVDLNDDEKARRVQEAKLMRMEDCKQEAIRLRMSKKKCHAKIIGTKYIESVIPRKDDMRGRLRHSPLHTGTPNVDADSSGQLRKEGITRLSEEFGLRSEYIGLLRRAGGKHWERRRKAAELKTYDETIGWAERLHPEVIAKVISSVEGSVVSPPAPLEWQHLKEYKKLKKQRQAASRAERERQKPHRQALSVQRQKEEDQLRAEALRAEARAEELEQRLAAPLKGERIEEAGLLSPYIAVPVETDAERRATTAGPAMGSFQWKKDCGKFPFYTDKDTMASLVERRRNPGFTIMRRVDLEEPVQTPAAHRRAMAKEPWHRADHASLFTRTMSSKVTV